MLALTPKENTGSAISHRFHLNVKCRQIYHANGFKVKPKATTGLHLPAFLLALKLLVLSTVTGFSCIVLLLFFGRGLVRFQSLVEGKTETDFERQSTETKLWRYQGWYRTMYPHPKILLLTII